MKIMISSEQKKLFRENYKKYYITGMDILHKKLLSIGGEAVVPQPEIREHLDALLTTGEVFNSKNIKMILGYPSHCHENSAKLWLRYEYPQIVTGWVLDCDTLWRQHSWLWHPNKKHIIETTGKRKIYFGTILNDIQSVKFLLSNVYPTELRYIKSSKRSSALVDSFVKTYKV